MGGWSFVEEVRRQVVAFNEENPSYYIEIFDFSDEDYEALLSGAEFDIIYSRWDHGIIENMIVNNMFADLWPFIYNDSEISEDDFFQNVLLSRQRNDGSLPIIASEFMIRTLVGMTEFISPLNSWTVGDVLGLVEDGYARGISYPLGWYSTPDFFLNFMLFHSGRDIIDLEAGESYLLSQPFLELLELLKLLSINESLAFNIADEESVRLREREQVLFLHNSLGVRDFVRSLYAIMEGEEFIIAGFPSNEGGVHSAFLLYQMGIGVNSNNQEVAWSFIRRFLLPDARIRTGIPMRIDLYENEVAEAIAAAEFEFPAVTQESANMHRALIDNVSHVARSNERVFEIIMEELQPFLEDERTAFETALIMQSRVQLFLDMRTQ
jgi:hypothetical protein